MGGEGLIPAFLVLSMPFPPSCFVLHTSCFVLNLQALFTALAPVESSPPAHSTMTTSIEVQTEMFEAHARALALRDSCKAPNTHRNYKGPIREWKVCPYPYPNPYPNPKEASQGLRPVS